jgi:hypothetical protein
MRRLVLVAATLIVLIHPLSDPAGASSGGGYWLAAADGGVFSFGDAQFYGSMGGTALNAPIVDIASTPSGRGYWLAASDGGVFTFGDAQFYGSMGGTPLSKPVTSIIRTPSGRGYWLMATDGGVFTFGDALFAGSGSRPNATAAVDMAATPTGRGYWLLGQQGGTENFGDAPFQECGGPLGARYVSLSGRSADGVVWLRSTGGVERCNQAPFFGGLESVGSWGGTPETIELTSTNGGYWIATSDGGVYAFGDAADLGTAKSIKLNRPIVGFASTG